MPFFLTYLIWRLGYDPRGLGAWTVLSWILLAICFFLMPGPNPNAGLTPANINYVWGTSDAAAQTWVPAYVWLGGLFVGLPLLFFVPTHFALRKLAPASR